MKANKPVYEITLTDYLMHRGDTGTGDGVALIWTEPTAPPPRNANVLAKVEASRELCIRCEGYALVLKGVESSCYSLALEAGLHVVLQSATGQVESYLLTPTP